MRFSRLLTTLVCLSIAPACSDSGGGTTLEPELGAGGGAAMPGGVGPMTGGGTGAGETPGGGSGPGPDLGTPGGGAGPAGTDGGAANGMGGTPGNTGGMSNNGGSGPGTAGSGQMGDGGSGGMTAPNGGAGQGGGPAVPVDGDGDGRFPMAAAPPDDPGGKLVPWDCDDTDATIFRGAPEVCGDNKDNNCDGMMDEADCIDPVAEPNCQMKMFEGKQYAFCPPGEGLWTQPKARLQCLMMGLELARIDTKAENDFIAGNLLNSRQPNGDTWIGGVDVPEPHKNYVSGSPTAEQWRWIGDEEVFFTGRATSGMPVRPDVFNTWGTTKANPPQQPNNIVGTYDNRRCRESCMIIRTSQNGSWYDLCCNNRNGGAACEAR